MFFILLVLIVLAAIVGSTLTVVAAYERAVVFRLGKLLGERGPGVVVIIRGIDEVKRVDVRLTGVDLPVQDLITSDDVPVRVRAVVYARIVDPVKVVVEVENYRAALIEIAQASLRAVVGSASLRQLLHDQAAVTPQVKSLLEQRTRDWGVEIGVVELTDVGVPRAVSGPGSAGAEAGEALPS